MRFKRFMACTVALAALFITVGCGQTDPGITAAVKSKFAADDVVKAYQLDVDTAEKVVTLTGTVDTPAAKSRAVELARKTEGVRNVIDNITVAETTATTSPPMPDAEPAVLTDPAITAAVKAKFVGDPTVNALKIDVDTRDGTVTLTGEVRTQAEREKALQIARETNGVKNVRDKLTIVP